ncbi:hypothetical protein CCYA_CCYA08G2242 [Cyanidiococcus yangmingshanensis]|nr:hypothetical protein CCYA_CCYA08G2242 [Cyanidiococcus yangmingshanensis]
MMAMNKFSRLIRFSILALIGLYWFRFASEQTSSTALRSVSAAPAGFALELVNLFESGRLALNISTFDSALLEDVNKTWENTTRHLGASTANGSRTLHPSEGLCFNRVLQEAAGSVVSTVETFCTPADVQDGNCSDIIRSSTARSLFSLGWTSTDVEIISEASQLPFILASLNSTGSGLGGSEYDLLVGLAKLVAERIKPNVEGVASAFRSAALAGIGSMLQNEAVNASSTNLYIILLFGKEPTQHCLSS